MKTFRRKQTLQSKTDVLRLVKWSATSRYEYLSHESHTENFDFSSLDNVTIVAWKVKSLK